MKNLQFSKTGHHFIVTAFLILILSSCNKNYTSHDQPFTESVEKELKLVAGSINSRLSYMKDVAAYKWENKLPIEDKARELVVIEASQTSANGDGLDSLTTREFFELQITLAKKIQHYWFKIWGESNANPGQFQDLQEVVRPELIRLGDEIIQNVSTASLERHPSFFLEKKKHVFMDLITIEGLSLRDKEELFEAVVAIKS